MCKARHFLLAVKMITLGEGPIWYDGEAFNRPELKATTFTVTTENIENIRWRRTLRTGRIIGVNSYKATVVDDNGGDAVIFIFENLSARLSTDGIHIHLDGTSEVVPSTPLSSQLLTLSAVYFDHAFPVASVLMGRKTELLYSRVFAFLKEVLPDWYPSVITCDFEKPLTIALRRAWPENRAAGCWFHSANIDEDRVRKAEKAGEEETKQARKRARMVRKKLIDDKAKEQDYEAGMF
ncbi:hypothetical protein J6590_079984 [Homalodisca vitripennis]|nr:hypothetical protein J6590_079984 [Homalodisca vitripennis]